MPGHEESRFVKLFLVDNAASLIARLVTRHATDGEKLVLGLSLGANVAM